MAIELMSGSYPTTTNTRCLEAASAGLQSVEKLIKLLSHQHERQLNLQPNNDNHDFEYKAAAEVAVSKFKSVISILDRPRTGHARFRRGPVQKPEPQKSHGSALRKVQPRLPPLPHNNNNKQHELLSAKTINFSSSPAISSTTSSLTCDTSMSTGFQMISSSLGKPPLSANSLKRKCSSVDDSSKCGASFGRCHCSKRRKSRMKRVVRIAAVSMKTADIPSDDYSWRKYGQKPIKGSPHPRGYYRCSSVKGCPARKHVERALDEPSVLVVTYEGDHNHPLHFNDASIPVSLILESS